MKYMNSNNNQNLSCCEMILGNNLDFAVNQSDCEIKVDMVVNQAEPTVRIWGQIRDCEGNAVPNVLIKLVRACNLCGTVQFQGIAHTISDCQGFYQFEVCRPTNAEEYKLLVSKAATGTDRVVDNMANCDPCGTPVCSPCANSNTCPVCPQPNPCQKCNTCRKCR